MKARELIGKLQEMIDLHGNREVIYYDACCQLEPEFVEKIELQRESTDIKFVLIPKCILV